MEKDQGKKKDPELEAFRASKMGKRLTADLNRLYVEEPALHELDFSSNGFAWVDCHDEMRHGERPLSALRRGQAEKSGDAEGVVVRLEASGLRCAKT